MGVDGARRGRRACVMLLPIAISLGNVCFRIISGELHTRAWEKEGSAARAVGSAACGEPTLNFAGWPLPLPLPHMRAWVDGNDIPSSSGCLN